MSSRVLSQLAIAAFIFLGVVSVGTRYWTRQEARIAREDSLWRLSYDIVLTVDEATDETSVRIALPSETQYCRLVDEEFGTGDLSVERRVGAVTKTRELVVDLTHLGKHRVTAEFELLLNPRGSWLGQPPMESLSPNSRSRYLRYEAIIPTRTQQVQRVLQSAPTATASDGELLQWIFDYCSREIRSPAKGNEEDASDDAGYALANRIATPLARARAMVYLCRSLRMPARLVTGFELRQEDRAKPHVWVEVFRGHSWVPFDPEYGYARYIPSNFVPVRRDGDTVINVDDITPEQKYSILRLNPTEVVLRSDMRHPAQIFDLTRLPLEMHKVIMLMLLLPLGALITSICRNVVGIQTFGTFSPALLAMSFIYADWGTGLVTLSVVVAAGLFGRNFLDRLRLLMVPRLSVILTTIILFVAFGVSLLDYMELTPSAQAVLLPLVILTIMIERVYVTTEEDGAMFAMQLALGTIVVATLCYLLLRWDDVGRVMLIYPELHFFTIAALIMIGRYAGYRLTELWRFREIVH